MLVLKTSKETIGNVIKYAKHASNTIPNAKPGDLVLLAQTISSLEPGQKQIRYIMTFKGHRLDISGESEKIWGKHWKYMIDGYDVIQIPGFNLKEVQTTDKNYGVIVTHCRLKPEDEKSVLRYISRRSADATSITRPKGKTPKEILAELEEISSKSPDMATVQSQRYFRDPRKSALLKELYNHKCQICGQVIFDREKHPHSETHHIIPRGKGGKDEICNMLVLCPNDHKRFELGSATIDLKTKIMHVDGKTVPWTNKHL